jgi:tetratricopeptide (TPR) repeat protein
VIFGIRAPALAAALIVVAALVAYANTFRAPFIFDDIASIVDNPTIRQLWPPGPAVSPPQGWGFTVSGRPLLNLSLAINHALSGIDVWSYHALNLLIHVLAGLTLFGISRRTLLRAPLAARLGGNAFPAAAFIAALWTLHPLQTESVTYVIQRAESLMGLFFLLTLYGFVRAQDSPRPGRWIGFSVVTCLLGIATKEIAALAPLLVFFYDRTFVSGTFRDALRRHWRQHLALLGTWIPFAWVLASTGGNRGGTVGFNVGIRALDYWQTQCEAITRYLGLSLWPHPQVFDYGKIAAPAWSLTALWAVPVLAIGIATLVALWRRPILGFLGVWFFFILAPTSMLPGALQMIVEHRMYLSLAAVIATVVGAAAWWLPPRAFVAAGCAVALAATVLTAARNTVYRSERALWDDVLAKRPDNARAHNNVGQLLYRQDRVAEAIDHYGRSVRLDPTVAQAQYNLGLALMKSGRLAEAEAAFKEAIRILPYFFNAHLNLALVLTHVGRVEEALPHFAEAIRFDASPGEAHFQFGVALAKLGRWSEAAAQYAECVALNHRPAEAHSNWGVALFRMNSLVAAIEHFNAALGLRPELADAHFNLALTLTQSGRPDEALPHYAAAVQGNPQNADAQLNFGIALAQQGRTAEAIAHLEEAVRLRPESPEVHTNLATALLDARRSAEALEHYRSALKIRPGDARAHYNVGFALLTLGRTAEARAEFEAALRLQPDFADARDMLRRLGGVGGP